MFAEENIGEWGSTFIFGLIIFIVCPVFFQIQNILLGMCLFEDSMKHFAHALFHVVQSTKVQLIVIYDLTLFTNKRNFGKLASWSGMGRLLLGYTLYILPLVGFGTLFMFGQSNVTLCRPLQASFLVDNNVDPVLNMSNLYKSRQLLGQKKTEKWDFINGKGGLVWDSYFNHDHYWDINIFGYRHHDYWPFNNMSDLIKQYNYMGLHDVCIYPASQLDLTLVNNANNLTSKGLFHVAHGYGLKNNSGTN